MRSSRAERKARERGKVYVLIEYLEGRTLIPHQHNESIRHLLAEEEAHPDVLLPATVKYLARWRLKKALRIAETREWCKSAWHGEWIDRDTNTWERVYPVLRARGAQGATGAEIADMIGLGHGAVSSALTDWAEAGCAARIR